MSDLRQQVPLSRRGMMRRNLSRWYSPRATARAALMPADGMKSVIVKPPRRISYALAGGVLALGAPTGLLLTRLVRRGEFSWSAVGKEIVCDGPTYAYVAGSTTIAFALFGGVLGHYADRLARLATTDSLTGLLNARAFDQRLRQEVARAARYGGPLALFVIDLDGLKRINDHQGHQAGDRALQSVASAIRHELREIDVAARLGGDEFGVLAPRTDETAAAVLGNRVRARAAESAAQAMLDNKYGCLPVVDEDMSLIGILTEADFVRLATERRRITVEK